MRRMSWGLHTLSVEIITLDFAMKRVMGLVSAWPACLWDFPFNSIYAGHSKRKLFQKYLAAKGELHLFQLLLS